MREKKLFHLWIALAIVGMFGGCQTEGELGTACTEDDHCPANQACDLKSQQCLYVAQYSPSLEVLPPSPNNQGLVAQEFITPQKSPDGKLRIKLQASVSITGQVIAKGDNKTINIPSRITAWRSSRLEGRPDVQIETTTEKNKNGSYGLDNDSHYVLWLAKDHSHTFYVAPLSPYDKEYPPLLIEEKMISDHTKLDFELDAKAVLVSGQLLDYAGNPLVNKFQVTDKDGKILSSSIRIRAYQQGSLNQSTIGESDSVSGAFSFKVPSVAAPYNLKIESLTGSIPIPTTICTNRVLGVATPQVKGSPTQNLGQIRLPSFLLPKRYGIKVTDKDGNPVDGTRVTFTSEIETVYENSGFDNCTASYSRADITDSYGRVSLFLIPGTKTSNRSYSVTVESPKTSKFASRWIKSIEVGPNEGQLAPIILDRRYRLRGLIISREEGKPVKGVSISATRILPSDSGNGPASDASTTSNEQGIFDLYADPGSYSINLQPPQVSGLPSISFITTLDRNIEGAVFELPKPQVVVGQILDPNGEILPQAGVKVYELIPEKSDPISLKAFLRATSITDSDGTFNLVLAKKPTQTSSQKTLSSY